MHPSNSLSAKSANLPVASDGAGSSTFQLHEVMNSNAECGVRVQYGAWSGIVMAYKTSDGTRMDTSLHWLNLDDVQCGTFMVQWDHSRSELTPYSFNDQGSAQKDPTIGDSG